MMLEIKCFYFALIMEIVVPLEVIFEQVDTITGGVEGRCRLVVETFSGNCATVTLVQAQRREVKRQIAKNSKYFCKHCTADICNVCFKLNCISHDVQYMGVKWFRCRSPNKLCEVYAIL